MDQDLAIIESERQANNLYVAGGSDYNKIWIRDNVYVALAFVEVGKLADAATIYRSLCAIISRFGTRLDNDVYATSDDQRIHPRYTTSGDIIPGEWGNKQHDALGILLFGIGQLNRKSAKQVGQTEKTTAQKIVHYLETSRYWEDLDNGMWEEGLDLHASSLAACIRGMEAVGDFCKVNLVYLDQATSALEKLLPRESNEHSTDLSQLSIIWPLGYARRDLVQNVESELLRDFGVIRYSGDLYEANGQSEPQWVMGIPWLGIAFFELGDYQKAKEYMARTEHLYTNNGLPESYLANNHECVHTPLAWSHALTIVLRAKLHALKQIEKSQSHG